MTDRRTDAGARTDFGLKPHATQLYEMASTNECHKRMSTTHFATHTSRVPAQSGSASANCVAPLLPSASLRHTHDVPYESVSSSAAPRTPRQSSSSSLSMAACVSVPSTPLPGAVQCAHTLARSHARSLAPLRLRRMLALEAPARRVTVVGAALPAAVALGAAPVVGVPAPAAALALVELVRRLAPRGVARVEARAAARARFSPRCLRACCARERARLSVACARRHTQRARTSCGGNAAFGSSFARACSAAASPPLATASN
jgi:hypothetical protein